jgi:mutator family transposase
VRRALNAVFAGPVGKAVVSRVWRKTKGDWDAWNARSLAKEPVVRLILDGTLARVRLDRKATSISLLVTLGVRADGQKMLLAIKSMGGESEAAWRARLDDFVRRGLPTSELVVVDGAPGLEKALAAYGPTWPSNGRPRQDLRRDARRGRDPAQGVHPQTAPQMPCRRRQLGGSRRQAVHLHPVPAEPMEVDPNLERDRAIA